MSVLLEGPGHLHHAFVHIKGVDLLQIHPRWHKFRDSQWTKMKSCCPVNRHALGLLPSSLNTFFNYYCEVKKGRQAQFNLTSGYNHLS